MPIIKTKQGMVDPTLWDKLKGWKSLREDIEKQLIDPGGVDPSITLEHGLQLMSTLRHSSKIRAMTHFTSTSAEVFLTHYKVGSLNMNCSWDVLTRVSGEFKFTVKKFETLRILAGIIFIPEHRVYVAYCHDLQLQVFTDSKTRCIEMSTTTCITTLLCMAYNSERDELITGGIGQLLRWNLHGIEKGVPLQPGKRFETSISEFDWVRDVKVDTVFKRILAMCGSKICMVNYETDKQTHFIESRHLGVPCCCSFYKQKEYFLTAGIDGCIKVWNASAIKQVHEFVGHYGRVTSLEIHKTDPLLISSSLDGTLQVWRMDNFQWLKRLDVGEGIYCMKLLGRGVLFCQTLNNVLIYSLNQFYNMFSPVESTVSCLKRLSWPGYSSIIITSTEDGSVRLLNPVTGSTISIIFPLPTFHVFSHFAYNRNKNLLFTLTADGAVLIFDCSSNPCVGVELRESHHDDPILSLTLVTIQRWNGDVDDMLTFVGHANGEVSLLDSTYHTLYSPLKIHGAGVTCLETVSGEYRRGNGLVGRLVSAGANNSIRVTDIIKKVNQVSFNPRASVRLHEIPLSLSMMGDVICAVVRPHKVTMIQVNFTSKKLLDMDKSPLTHSINDDHTTAISGLDCCKALGLFITAGNDGFVKLWDMENVLIRELHFGDSLQGVCFANLRGDILVGFQRHVCSVSILRYLPVYLLEKVVKFDFEDDQRESPLSFNNKLRLSIEPKQLPTFSTNLEKRKSQIKDWRLTRSSDLRDLVQGHWTLLDDLAEKVWAQQRQGAEKESLDLVSAVGLTESPASQPESLSPYIAFGLKRIVDWMRLKKRDAEEKAQTFSGAQLEQLGRPWRLTLEEHVKYTELKLEIMAQNKWKEVPLIPKEKKINKDMAVEIFEGTAFGKTSLRSIADWRELAKLYRKWTIPQDGYIPNSVVRARFDQEFGLPEVDIPVPVIARRAYKGKSPRRRRLTPLSFGSRPSSRRATKTPEGEIVKPLTPLPTSSPKFNQLLQDMFKKPKLAEFVQKKPFDSKPLQLSSLQPFDFSAVPLPEPQKKIVDTEKKTFIEEIKVSGGLIFTRIVKENWFPTHITFQRGAIISTLLNLMDSSNPIINKHVSRYMVELTKTQAVPQIQQIDFIKALLEQLGNADHNIQKEAIWCLGELGLDHEDIILALIPKLIAENPMIREEATIAIQKILGINNKDDLLIALEKRGYVTGYVDNKVQSEDEIFSKLKQKTEEVLSPVAQSRVMGWLNSTAFPGGPQDESFTPAGFQESDLPGGDEFRKPILGFPRRPKKTRDDEPIGPSRRRGAKGKAEKSDEDLDDDQTGGERPRKERRSSVVGRWNKGTKSGRRGSITSSGRRGSLVSSKRRSSIAPDKEEPLDMADMEQIAEMMGSNESLEKSGSRHSAVDSVGSDMDEAKEDSSDEDRLELDQKDRSRKGSRKSQPRYASRGHPLTDGSVHETRDSFDSSEEESLGDLTVTESSAFVNMEDGLEESSKQELWNPGGDEMESNPSLTGTGNDLDETSSTTESSVGDLSKMSQEDRDKMSSKPGRFTASRSTQGSKGRSSGTPATTGTPAARPGLGAGLGVDRVMPSASVGTMIFSDQTGRIEPTRGRGVLLFDQKQLNELQNAALTSPDTPKLSPEEVTAGLRLSREDNKKGSLGLTPEEPKSEKDRLREAEERARLLSNKDWIEEKSSPEQRTSTEPAEGRSSPSKDSMDTVTAKDTEDKNKQSLGKGPPLGRLKFEDQQKRNVILSDDSAILSQQSQDFFSEHLSQQLSGVDGHSTIDSGISPDTSDSSFRGPRPYGALIDRGFPSLSPVKSLADTAEEQEYLTENWREFFKRSTAQERKRLELVKKDFIEGRTKPLAVHLPPISYVKDNVQLRAGNSGFRLLHSVSINEKEAGERKGKHRIEPIPGKLGIDTKSESHGSSNFGILKMQWTTNVPLYYGQEFVGGAKKPTSASSRSSRIQSELPPIDDRRLQGQALLTRPTARDSGVRRVYKWQTPLPPPPPPRASCTQFSSDKKHHDHYCRYYSLAKKNMHKYTSALLPSLHRGAHKNISRKTLLLDKIEKRHSGNDVRSPDWSSSSRSQQSMSQKG